MKITTTKCISILTRTSGYLKGVCSHSLNPYIGCGYGNSSCGEGCYVQFNQWLNRGRDWGDFVDVKVNADTVYLNTVKRMYMLDSTSLLDNYSNHMFKILLFDAENTGHRKMRIVIT